MRTDRADVLVIGAGPTGLSLAAALAAHGVVPRVVDRGTDRVAESRALAVQPRTLEVLEAFGVTDALVERGNRAAEIRLHVGGRVRPATLSDLRLPDTAYPYLLLLSQAETEKALDEHLAEVGVSVERGVELTELRLAPDAAVAMLRHRDGTREAVSARYVVGCDGAHSTVRHQAGIAFAGGAYPQTFVLADLEADGLGDGGAGTAHVFVTDRGPLLFIPLVRPAGWRMLAMRPTADPTPPDAAVTLPEVQALVDRYTGHRVRVRDPVWMTNFRNHHRAAARYRAGPVFLAGDAAHIHSPAGGQGMNTGIQDAVNLGWKLAYTLRGRAVPELLDTYHQERAPVGRRVLRFTDRIFTAATSAGPLPRLARTRLLPTVAPLALRWRAVRRYAFRTISQLGIRYRTSPLSTDGGGPPRHGPRAGDRLPDTAVVAAGRTVQLHAALARPGWHLLLCGPVDAWPDPAGTLAAYRDLVHPHHLAARGGPDVLLDPGGHARSRLGVARGGSAQILVRPDGHIGYRAGGTDLTGLTGYLRRWLRTG